eukprot:CAMPEP_0181217310 /NCGR_PEP_ID=MMETSP1096-20121128/27078_1 /TAXON_ID=156174 ORGANISM="Chrysochromulina ericina, Strain CCMP281" /NCGR_SAMPLE_ID=MMETSP1096 /ASSEMBLY_ACC=CAM_ASM_000453 /LENGTH=65 /DNA_ID=CAMNT_0023309423 /DNA_START=208 /DNA_END=406 /DNA_ORIENTATION=-
MAGGSPFRRQLVGDEVTERPKEEAGAVPARPVSQLRCDENSNDGAAVAIGIAPARSAAAAARVCI